MASLEATLPSSYTEAVGIKEQLALYEACKKWVELSGGNDSPDGIYERAQAAYRGGVFTKTAANRMAASLLSGRLPGEISQHYTKPLRDVPSVAS